MPAAEIDYLLRHQGQPGDSFTVSSEARATAIQRISAVAEQLSAEYTKEPVVDASAMGKVLAQIVPAERVVQIVAAIEGGNAAEQQALLTRYAAAFLPTDPSDLFAELATLVEPTERFELVGRTIRDQLEVAAREAAVVATAAELVALPQDDHRDGELQGQGERQGPARCQSSGAHSSLCCRGGSCENRAAVSFGTLRDGERSHDKPLGPAASTSYNQTAQTSIVTATLP